MTGILSGLFLANVSHGEDDSLSLLLDAGDLVLPCLLLVPQTSLQLSASSYDFMYFLLLLLLLAG